MVSPVNAAWIELNNYYINNTIMIDMTLEGTDLNGEYYYDPYSVNNMKADSAIKSSYTYIDNPGYIGVTESPEQLEIDYLYGHVRSVRDQTIYDRFGTNPSRLGIGIQCVDEYVVLDPKPLWNGTVQMNGGSGSTAFYEFIVHSDFGNTGQVDVNLDLIEYSLPSDANIWGYNFLIKDSNSNVIFSVSVDDDADSVNGNIPEALSLNLDEVYYLYVDFYMESEMKYEIVEGLSLGVWQSTDLYVNLELSVDQENFFVPVPSAIILFCAGLLGLIRCMRIPRTS